MKDMKKEIKEYTDKKLKERVDMEKKSCKNCDKCRNCAVRTKVEEISYIDTDFWHCSRWEAKKKTVKLFRYTHEYDGTTLQSLWTTHPFEAYSGVKLLKTETKEIDL